MGCLSFKARLALWHVLAVAAILSIAAVGGHWVLERSVLGQVDAALETLAEVEAASLQADPRIPIRIHEVTPGTAPPSLVRLDRFVQVVTLDGAIVARSANLGTAQLPITRHILARLEDGQIVFETSDGFADEPIRVVALPVAVGNRRYAVQVAGSLDDAHAVLSSARWLFLGLALTVLGAVAAASVRFASTALRPIGEVVTQARRIGESSLSERLPQPATQDELGGLVGTLNAMLDRIERGLESQRRFTTDASHELRSPLSRLRAELEVTLRRPRERAEYEEALRSCLDEVERLSLLTEHLLTLARLDAEAAVPVAAPVPLAPILDEAIHRLRPRADGRGVELVRDGAPSLAVCASPASVSLALANVIDNAVKFSPAGGVVRIGITSQGEEAVIFVSDSGPGVALEDVPRLFDRFHRGAAARSGASAGFGLGLAISRAAIERHGGRIASEPRPGGGATFSIWLPLSG